MKNLYFSVINNGYTPFAKNFIERLKQIKFTEDFLIVCIDELAYNFISNFYEKTTYYRSPCLSYKFEQWDTEQYKKIVFTKLDIKKQIIKENFNKYDNIIFMDTDIWIEQNFSNSLNKILKNTNYDLIFQDGENYQKNKDDCCIINNNCIEKKRPCYNHCTGLMIMNTSSKNKIIKLLSYKKSDFEKFQGNQSYINSKLKLQKLNVFTLPKKICMNYSNNKFEKTKKTWMIHYSYLIGKDKITKMKENGHWIID